jgi:hypothetical protein
MEMNYYINYPKYYIKTEDKRIAVLFKLLYDRYVYATSRTPEFFGLITTEPKTFMAEHYIKGRW